MAEKRDAQTIWLPVIARSLAYLCLMQAQGEETDKFNTVLKRVRFLEALGLDLTHAAKVVGSSPESVRELARLKRKGVKNAGKRKARR